MTGEHRNSLGRAAEIVETVLDDRSRLGELFECVFDDDAWVRMRAIDSFEKIVKDNPEWAKPYITRIFGELTKSDQPSIQWHLAQIFTEVELTLKQQQHAIDWLKDKLKNVEVDWIVSGDAMKALLYFYSKDSVGAAELEALFKIQEGHKSKAIRTKASKLLQELDKAENLRR